MPSEASTCSSPFSWSIVTSPRMLPWCLPRISSTLCSAERMFSVPDIAWLTSSSVESRRDSRASRATGSTVVRVLAILLGAGSHRFVVGNRDRLEERHHLPELGADLLDLVRALHLALRLE